MISVLAADIGGTHARFGLFNLVKTGLSLRQTLIIDTSAVESFADLVGRMMEDGAFAKISEVAACCIAAAGPVEGERVTKLTNVEWGIDAAHVRSRFPQSRVVLANDFAAMSASVLSPIAATSRAVLDGVPNPDGPIAVLGAGTGFGKGVVLRKGVLTVPSEGGHASLPVASKEEFEFLEFLRHRFESRRYPSYEDVLSGRGLTALHEFLAGEVLSPAEVAQRFESSPRTVEWFARFFGRAARNFALETLSTGGVFVAGGIVAKNPVLVEHRAFAEEFHAAQPHQALLLQMPVKLITDELAGLWGAAVLASQSILGR